jgi:histone arginine demethylase JMJD6
MESLSSTEGLVDNFPRIHVDEVSLEEFIERFEKPRQPVVILGLTDQWPAAEKWEFSELVKTFGSHKFKVGSDDDGYAVRLKLKYYLHYLKTHALEDDSPLYIFDGTFADRKTSKDLAKDYTMPKYFQEDLFQHVGEKRRPPHKWIVWGPARSGSSLHIDPLATGAWNALLKGTKRWCLFPPGVPRCLTPFDPLLRPSHPLLIPSCFRFTVLAFVSLFLLSFYFSCFCFTLRTSPSGAL